MRAGWAKPQLQKPLWLLLLQHYKHYIHHTLSIKGFLWKRRPTKIFLYKTLTSITIVQLYMRREKSDQPASWPLNYQKINISCSAKRPPISRKCWRPQLPQSKHDIMLIGSRVAWISVLASRLLKAIYHHFFVPLNTNIAIDRGFAVKWANPPIIIILWY